MSETVWLAIIAGLVAGIPASIAAWGAMKNSRQIEQVHKATNSLADRLIASSNEAGLAIGRAEGREEGLAQAVLTAADLRILAADVAREVIAEAERVATLKLKKDEEGR